mgnify:CR=1 FL=1
MTWSTLSPTLSARARTRHERGERSADGDSETVMAEWVCQQCTFSNQPGQAQCEMCGQSAEPDLGTSHGTIRHKVEVDQRALVDKILARYATDFGALRELVQNADDAGATEVEVELLFAIGGSEPSRIKVWNNGRAFNEADWLRVRKIAAGNPDESSVGLFGVGFFSVFALTDAPEIHSGSVRLRFRSLAQP